MFPIWINDGKTSEPEESIFYELAANGIFIHKKMPLWDVVVPVERISILDERQSSISLHLPPIPERIVYTVIQFFFWVYCKYGTEAGALLLFNEKTKEYDFLIPKQEVSENFMRYAIPDLENGWKLVGTTHSHHYLEAFNSSTDKCDEQSIDGIHITFGSFSKYRNNIFSCNISAAINGYRFPLDPTQWLIGIMLNKRIKKASGLSFGLDNQPSFLYTFADQRYLMLANYDPPREWKEKLKVQSFNTIWRKGKGEKTT